MRGIDISNWQQGLDLAKLVSELDFVICKVSEGTGFKDKYAKAWLDKARALGLLTGIYHYARHNNPEDDADYFLKCAGDEVGRSILVLDYEEGQGGAWADRFFNRIKSKTGIYPLIYCSASVCSDFSKATAEKCGLWLAGYPRDYTSWISGSYPYSVKPWSYAVIWQFTSSLRLNGWSGKLDGDIAYIDAKQWTAYAKGSPAPSQDNLVAACKVILGDYSTGKERIEKLKAAGYDPDKVQSVVNDIYSMESRYLKCACKIMRGDFGNGDTRIKKLRDAGYDPDISQEFVNMLLEVKL